MLHNTIKSKPYNNERAFFRFSYSSSSRTVYKPMSIFVNLGLPLCWSLAIPA